MEPRPSEGIVTPLAEHIEAARGLLYRAGAGNVERFTPGNLLELAELIAERDALQLGAARLATREGLTPDDRVELLEALISMPDEAFGWFVAWCMTGFPDGLGGFKPESRQSITALRAAAIVYRDALR